MRTYEHPSYQTDRAKTGRVGEEAVAAHLGRYGYSILHRNFRIGRLGEIDIIAEKNGVIFFVEVKTRTGLSFGLPAEAVNKKKIEKIRKLASAFMANRYKETDDRAVEFIVAEVTAAMEKGEPIVKYIKIIREAF